MRAVEFIDQKKIVPIYKEIGLKNHTNTHMAPLIWLRTDPS